MKYSVFVSVESRWKTQFSFTKRYYEVNEVAEMARDVFLCARKKYICRLQGKQEVENVCMRYIKTLSFVINWHYIQRPLTTMLS